MGNTHGSTQDPSTDDSLDRLSVSVFEILPGDVLLLVLARLEVSHLLAFMCTCRRASELSKKERLWRMVYEMHKLRWPILDGPPRRGWKHACLNAYRDSCTGFGLMLPADSWARRPRAEEVHVVVAGFPGSGKKGVAQWLSERHGADGVVPSCANLDMAAPGPTWAPYAAVATHVIFVVDVSQMDIMMQLKQLWLPWFWDALWSRGRRVELLILAHKADLSGPQAHWVSKQIGFGARPSRSYFVATTDVRSSLGKLCLEEGVAWLLRKYFANRGQVNKWIPRAGLVTSSYFY